MLDFHKMISILPFSGIVKYMVQVLKPKSIYFCSVAFDSVIFMIITSKYKQQSTILIQHTHHLNSHPSSQQINPPYPRHYETLPSSSSKLRINRLLSFTNTDFVSIIIIVDHHQESQIIITNTLMIIETVQDSHSGIIETVANLNSTGREVCNPKVWVGYI